MDNNQQKNKEKNWILTKIKNDNPIIFGVNDSTSDTIEEINLHDKSKIIEILTNFGIDASIKITELVRLTSISAEIKPKPILFRITSKKTNGPIYPSEVLRKAKNLKNNTEYNHISIIREN